MTFLDHLEELRKRIFYSLIALGVTAVVAFFFSQQVLDLLTRSVPKLVFLAPAEAFVVQLKVALTTGVFLAAPVIFYQFWRFVRPALQKHEVKYISAAVSVCSLLFVAGVAFAYLVVVPISMRFLLGFETPKLQAMISISEYVGTVGAFLLACGVIFQLPVIMFFMTKLGVITPKLLMKNQRIAVVLVFIAAAILSPPDVFSQILMAVPLLALFELGVVASYLAKARRSAGG
ncbi:twin-arginine translocase subunit TatC [candidate division WOR-3 bacterium]|uniref:Sec-independent protein translocase protein TatC n=1 Tax=candidate division WOR-3 bacterium TaxID=2052148 RepID=A0A937XCN9_UNCW3|nr:twin-arginine translocase subunit TatC [candidate division WOR-3 bacterium]